MSIRAANRDRQAALAVMLKAYRVFGGNSFLVDPKGRNWSPLHHAEREGWCRFWRERCRLTEAGIDQLADYAPSPEGLVAGVPA